MRSRHCRICGDWHPLNEPWPIDCIPVHKFQQSRSELSAPMIVRDGQEPVQSQVTGQWHDSKSALRAEYKANGVIEIGNDAIPNAPPTRPKVTREEIAAAYKAVKYEGYRPQIEHAPTTVSETGVEWT
jgi:hypothetical protein